MLFLNILSLNNGGVLLKKPVVLVFLVVFIFYIIVTGGNFWESDSMVSYQTAKSMVDNFSFSIPCFGASQASNGECYSQYGLFISVAIIPFYLVEKFFRDFLHNSFFFQGFFSTFTNPFYTALLVAVFFATLQKLKFNNRISIAGALIFGLSTYISPYTKSLYSEPLLTLFIYLVVYFLLFLKPTYKNLVIAGLFFGLAFLTKISAVLAVPSLLYLFIVKKFKIGQIAVLMLPVAFCIVIFFAYNFIRFGDILDTGYRNIKFDHPLLYGLYLHLLSPGKSFFLYQPFILFSFLGFKYFFQKSRDAFVTFFLLFATYLIFYSVYMHPMGDLAWGSRYIFPAVGFFVIGAIFFLRYSKKKFLKISFCCFVLVSFLIQLSALYLSYHRYFAYSFNKWGNNYTRILYNQPDKSPLLGQWKIIFRIGYNKSDAPAWRQAFQEFHRDEIIPKNPFEMSDMFFFRSKINLIFLAILLLLEGYFVFRLLKI